MNSLDVINQLLALGSYAAALKNGEGIDEARQALKNLLESADMSFVLQIVNVSLQSFLSYDDSNFEEVKPLFAEEIASIGLNAKLDAGLLIDMKSILFSAWRNTDLAGAMTQYDAIREALLSATDITRALALTFYRQVLSNILTSKNIYDYVEQIGSICAALATFTEEEIEEYGISAAIMQQ